MVDNCKIYEEENSDAYSERKSTKSTEVPSVKTNPKQGTVDYEQLTEELLKKVTQVQKPLRRCYNCGGDHLNKDCPTLPQPPKLKWCAIEQKYINHTTEECYYNKGYVRERPAIPQGPVAPPPPRFMPGNYQGAMERPKPVLGAQPPLPGDQQVAVRYAQGGEESEEKALVPTAYYEEQPMLGTSQGQYAYEEPIPQDYWNLGSNNLSVNNEGKVSLDVPTLMFIAGQGGMVRPRPTYPQCPYAAAAPAQPRGPCYHYVRDCPRKDLVRIHGYCSECGKSHLIAECPNHPDKKPNTTLNVC